MKEIMIAYWSGTGNTAAMAAILGKGIQDGGATAKVVSVEDIKADDLKDYPVFALGCPSMGNETLEETYMKALHQVRKSVYLVLTDGETVNGCATG